VLASCAVRRTPSIGARHRDGGVLWHWEQGFVLGRQSQWRYIPV